MHNDNEFSALGCSKGFFGVPIRGDLGQAVGCPGKKIRCDLGFKQHALEDAADGMCCCSPHSTDWKT